MPEPVCTCRVASYVPSSTCPKHGPAMTDPTDSAEVRALRDRNWGIVSSILRKDVPDLVTRHSLINRILDGLAAAPREASEPSEAYKALAELVRLIRQTDQGLWGNESVAAMAEAERVLASDTVSEDPPRKYDYETEGFDGT